MKNTPYKMYKMAPFFAAGMLAVLLAVPETTLQWQGYFEGALQRTNQDLKSARGPKRHWKGVVHFYNVRTNGKFDVNVDLVNFEAARQEAVREAFSLHKSTADVTWTSVGPHNVAGRMRAIAFHPTDTNIVYVGAAAGGVFKTLDGGRTWKAVMDYTPAIPVGALAIDPTDPNVIYAGTGEPVYSFSRAYGAPIYLGAGIMKSTDGGASWTQLKWPRTSSAVHRLLIDETRPGTLFAATTVNLFKTTDGGNTWTNVLSNNITDLQFKPGSKDILYAAVGVDQGSSANGFYVSTQRGEKNTWVKQATNFVKGDSTGRIIFATTAQDPELIYAFVSKRISNSDPLREYDFLALQRSTNGGADWERVISTLPQDFGHGQLNYDFACAINPQDKNMIFVGGLEVWRSVNGGDTFLRRTLGNEPVHVDQHVQAFQPVSNHLWITNDGGVYKSRSNGDSWESLEITLETAQFYSVAVSPSKPWVLYGGTQDNGTLQLYSKENKEWTEINSGDGGWVSVYPGNENIVFARVTVSEFPMRLYYNNGRWERTLLNNGFSTAERVSWTAPMQLHPRDASRLHFCSQYVYVAIGAHNLASLPTFNRISDDLTKSNGVNSRITALAFDSVAKDWCYVGTGDGKVHRTSILFQPDPVWEDISEGIPDRWVSDILISRESPWWAWVTSSGYGDKRVLKTTDGGSSWIDITGNLPNVVVNTIVQDRNTPSKLYVGTDIGVYTTVQGDTIWEKLGTGLPNVVISDMLINGHNNLVAATFGRGIWTANLTLAAERPEPKLDYALEQSYPNPLGSSSTASISYTLPKNTEATLEVFDASGRKIATLAEGRKNAGAHTAQFHAASLPDGTYFYRLRTSETVLTRKMMIVR